MQRKKLNVSSFKDFRTYAWNYLSLHASQRLTTFNFYLVSSAFLTNAILTALKEKLTILVIGLGIILAVLSLVFWKLDQRTRNLVKNGERALKFLDDGFGLEDLEGHPHDLKLISRDDSEFGELRKIKSFWPSKIYLSYSNCFEYVFFAFGAVGLLLALLAALKS